MIIGPVSGGMHPRERAEAPMWRLRSACDAETVVEQPYEGPPTRNARIEEPVSLPEARGSPERAHRNARQQRRGSREVEEPPPHNGSAVHWPPPRRRPVEQR